MDPVLKGTTFGKALEDAERDIQRKREQREREKETGLMRTQARALADAIRGGQWFPPPAPKPDPKPQPQPQKKDDMTTLAPAQPLTAAQLHVLAEGIDTNAKLPKGNFTKRLFDEGLIVRSIDKHYRTTDKGRDHYMAWATNDITVTETAPDPIEDVPESINNAEIALTALQMQNKELHEMAAGRQKRIDELMAEIERLKQAGMNDVDAARYQTLLAALEIITPMMDEDDTGLALPDYIADLRRRLKEMRAGFIAWNEGLIIPLVQMINERGPGLFPDETHNNVQLMMQFVRDLAAIADDRMMQIEQRDTQIEALRRSIDEWKLAADEWQRRYKAADRDSFAALVLNELCDILPEVAAYYTAREGAVKAINGLKARRS